MCIPNEEDMREKLRKVKHNIEAHKTNEGEGGMPTRK